MLAEKHSISAFGGGSETHCESAFAVVQSPFKAATGLEMVKVLLLPGEPSDVLLMAQEAVVPVEACVTALEQPLLKGAYLKVRLATDKVAKGGGPKITVFALTDLQPVGAPQQSPQKAQASHVSPDSGKNDERKKKTKSK